MEYTITLEEKTFPIIDITSINFHINKEKHVTFEINTGNHGDFVFECEMTDTQKFNNLFALKTELISTLKAIAEGRIPRPE